VVSARENLAYQPDPSRVRFAIAPVLSPRATLENYSALAAYLGERLGKTVELVQGNSYAEINALVHSGDATLALVCSGAFVVARREFGMQALVVPVINGENTYHSYLIVPARSGNRGWEDLRHKAFAFTDPLSNTGRLVPLYVLSQMGETPDKFFQNFIFTYSHDNSIRAVAEGLVDGAAVSSLVYDFMVRQDPSLATRIHVVWRSPPYGMTPVVVHPAMPLEARQQLEAIFLNMSTDAKGQEVLRDLGVDAFVRPDPSAYDTIEAVMQATGAR
jgi:phosphonate transport system substrate-binding protein